MSTRKNLLIFISTIVIFALGWSASIFYYSNAYTESDGTQIIYTTKDTSTGSIKDMDLSLFWDVWGIVDDNYVNEGKLTDEDDIVYGAIKGLVNSLEDPYSVFMTPKETEDFNVSLSGSLEGIGAELVMEDGLLTVLAPIKDSPAEAAGLKSKDIIFLIDDEHVAEMTFFESVMKIRGEKGTQVSLTIVREDVEEPLVINIIRDEINLSSVYYEMLEEGIAYINISQFTDQTNAEFDKAVQEILLQGAEGLILDLRYNGGGYLDVSIDILSEFVQEEQIGVIIAKRDPNDKEVQYTQGESSLPDIPLVVLINESSASAAEILAGALQDYKRGVLIGTQSYGKGTVQEVDLLEDGSSLRLTVAKWLTPSGREIEEIGIEPDVIVELDLDELEAGTDSQLKEAIRYIKSLETNEE
jgi:carboxyl-terminal processing protease